MKVRASWKQPAPAAIRIPEIRHAHPTIRFEWRGSFANSDHFTAEDRHPLDPAWPGLDAPFKRRRTVKDDSVTDDGLAIVVEHEIGRHSDDHIPVIQVVEPRIEDQRPVTRCDERIALRESSEMAGVFNPEPVEPLTNGFL